MGKNQLRILQFAIRYPYWHTFGKDRSTVDAIRSLERLGLIEVNTTRQFRLALPDGTKQLIDSSN